MTAAAEILIALFLVVGGLFGLIGSLGLWKLRDAVQRVHAPSKASTLGVGAVLAASAVLHWMILGQPSWQEPLVILFLFITAPVSALFLVKVHLHERISRDSLPDSGTGRPWATYQEGTPAKDGAEE